MIESQEFARPATPLLKTSLPLPLKGRGKVRDLYDVTLDNGQEALLLVATDRLSAFDVIMGNGIAGKGIVLTQLACFWFGFFAPRLPHHVITTDPLRISGLSDADRAQLEGRIMVCKRLPVVPVECVARGYLTGSGWAEYQRDGEVCGHPLPEGLRNGDRLPQAIFTPAHKVDAGHDENIDFATLEHTVGPELAETLAQATLMLYEEASRYAASRGLILADTKFEFGLDSKGDLVLIDEALTPDSSRFWPADGWTPGQPQASFDKQFIRDYLETLVAEGAWDRQPPGPVLPDAVLQQTLDRYLDAYSRLTGHRLRFV
ncbi:MAG: phosphoribosylaminoimidazolesuccinocarboxamide synthase [Pseudomonadota bacterium]|nr:phosphoribosylaminoimidazolesuccinocarboxamide synthase [Pseudomonadota bacterium]